MADAILVYWGSTMIPVKTNVQISEGNSYSLIEMSFGNSGALLNFKVGGHIYEYYESVDFDRAHRNIGGNVGYYRKDSFKKYKQGLITLHQLKTEANVSGYIHKFPVINSFSNEDARGWGFHYAEAEDTVEVEILSPIPPFIGYYHEKKYSFSPEILGNGDIPKSYTKPEEFPDAPEEIYTSLIDISAYPSGSIVPQSATGSFYKENFSDYVVSLNNIDDEEKKGLAKQMTFICWKIFYLQRDSLKKLAIKELSDIESAMQLKFEFNDDSTFNELQRIDKLIGNLLKDWGFLYGYGFPASKILSSTPNLKELNRYYNLLNNFHRSLIYQDENVLFPENSNGDPIDEDGYIITLEQDSERRIKRLYASLFYDLTLLSIEDRLAMLNDFIKKDEIKQDEEVEIDEADILHLLASIESYNDANRILDLLLEIIEDKSDGKRKTKFEKLYYLMDDKRLDRIFIIQWFVDEDNNRQHFINALYRIWKISKFNLFYVPDNIIPNEDGLNSNCFFLDETAIGGAKYYAQYDSDGNVISGAEPILEWETVDNDVLEGSYLFYQVSDTDVSYRPEKKLKKELITINKVESAQYINAFSQSGFPTTVSSPSFYGNYHIYQPICLLGYQADLELSIPNMEPIPAFLFFYSEEFDRLKDIDAAISFAAELIVEIGLFFATGGWSAIGHLRHLRHITKLRHLKVVGSSLQLVGVTAQDAILVWRGIEDGVEVIAVTAGMMTSLFNYQANISNDPEEVELNRKISTFFLILTFASAGKAIFSRYKAVKKADEIIKNIDDLSANGITYNVPSDVLSIIYTVGNKIALKTIQNINALAQDFPSLANKLLVVKNSGKVKLAFELSEIISKRKRSFKTKIKFNNNPSFIDQFDDLTKVTAFKNISGFYDDFYRISELQNAQKGREVFSEFIDGISSNDILHTMDEVYDMHNHGIANNLKLEDIRGLIIKSFRTQKQVDNIVTVKQWMNNYKNFLINEIPYPFNNVSHFTAFKVEIGNLFSKYRIGNQITIGGSSLTKLIPPDLDLVLYLNPSKYDDLVRHYENVLKEVKAYSKANKTDKYERSIRSIERALTNSKNNGKIDVRCMVNFEIIGGQPKLTSFLSELKASSFTNNLNVTNDLKKAIDFNIYKSAQGNRSISLPPEFNINL